MWVMNMVEYKNYGFIFYIKNKYILYIFNQFYFYLN